MKQRRAVVFCVRGVPRCLTRASADGRACCVCIATIVNSAAVARRVQIFLRYPVGISLDADPEMGHGRIVWSLHCRFFFRILFVVFHSGRTSLRFEVPGFFFNADSRITAVPPAVCSRHLRANKHTCFHSLSGRSIIELCNQEGNNTWGPY